MTFNRDKNYDRKITKKLIALGRNATFTEPSWLDHKGKGAILDFELLKGATKGHLVFKSGRKLSAVNAHIYHLKREHGLEVVVEDGKYLLDADRKDFELDRNNHLSSLSSNTIHRSGIEKGDGRDLLKEDHFKIGQLVKNYISKIFDHCNSIDNSEFDRLMDGEYSKKVFNIKFPFCKRVSQINSNEDVRFWKNEYDVKGMNIRVCSQWYKESKPLFLAYLYSKNIITESEYQSFKNFNYTVTKHPPLPNNYTVKESYLEDKEVFKFESQKVNESSLQQIEVKGPLDQNLDKEAARMSKYYRVFYAMERSIRILIVDVMKEKYGKLWWEKKVDYRVKENVKRNLEYELDTPHSKRSEHNIDYSTFGDLRKIINTNWIDFQPKFKRNLSSVNEILIDLNRIRVPIAHCTPLPEREVKRLEVRVEDWFDLLE